MGLRPPLQRVVVRYRAATGGRVVIVDRSGRRVADSHPTSPSETELRDGARPEILTALHGHVATGIRYSSTLHTRLLYVAVPVASGGALLGAVRITYPTSTLDARVTRYRLALLAVGLLVIAAAAVTGLVLARSISRPLRRLEQVAGRVGAGDLTARARQDDGPPEVRRLAAELNRSTAKLEALLASQEQFVADASHELRTPLTALRLRLETGDHDGAIAEVDRLARLVGELLALARADAGREAASEVDLAGLVAARVEAWEPLATERGVRLVAPEVVGVVVRVGPGRVEQVLDNLLSNALEVAPRGSSVVVRLAGRGIARRRRRARPLGRGPCACVRSLLARQERPGIGARAGDRKTARRARRRRGRPSASRHPAGVDAVVRYPALRVARSRLRPPTVRS